MKLALVLFLSLAAALLGNGVYMLRGNPEISFARKVVREQDRQLERTQHEQQVIFIGGSSCSFSIDPDLLREKYGLAACNLGLPAGTGRGLHLERALQEVGKGDVLVLAFEMTGWDEQEGEWVTPLGSQLWYGAVGKHYGMRSRLQELGLKDQYRMSEVRPGGKHSMTMMMKALLQKPLFRYQDHCIQTGGYLCQSASDWPLTPRNSVETYRLSPSIAEVLSRIVDEAIEREAQVVVSLPWFFTAEEVAEKQRLANRELVEELEEFCPVLYDSHWGVETKRENFSDTNWHLSRSGAEERSHIVGGSLREFLSNE